VKRRAEKMILEHKPVPGYRRAFHIVLAVGVAYLAAVFGWALIQ